jgi:hypothetical protein
MEKNEKNSLKVGQRITITKKMKYFCPGWIDPVNNKSTWFPEWSSSNKLYIKGFQIMYDEYYVQCYVKGEDKNILYYFLYSDIWSMIIEQNKEIIGYKLLKELPFVQIGVESYLDSENECYFITNSVSIQDAFVFTKEEMGEKPDWFQPIYKKQEKTFKLSNGKEVKINKNGIYADGVNGEISILGLKNLLRPGQTSLNFLTVELKDATFKIGCWENVKFSEIKEMLEIYENLKK